MRTTAVRLLAANAKLCERNTPAFLRCSHFVAPAACGRADFFDLVLMDLHSASAACSAAALLCFKHPTVVLTPHFFAAVPVMDGLSATRAICRLVSSGVRPHAPIVVRCAAASSDDLVLLMCVHLTPS